MENTEKFRKALDLGVELREMEEEADLEEKAEAALDALEEAESEGSGERCATSSAC